MRTQQRMMLYYYMVANEKQVPSVSSAIIERIWREHKANEEGIARKKETQVYEQRVQARQDITQAAFPIPLYAHSSPRRRFLQHVLTLATVAAVLLAAVGLLNHFAGQSGATLASLRTTEQKPLANPGVGNNDWNSALIGLTMLSTAGMVRSLAFYNYDASQNRMVTLVESTQTYLAVNTDGISTDGQSLLFDDISQSQQKVYQIFSPATNVQTVYQIDAKRGGNAIWMDTTHILTQRIDGGVQELDTQTGVLQSAWTLRASRLTFYHHPFLYFTGAQNLKADVLYRANLSQANPIPQQVTQSLPNTHFWLSIDGTTISYADQGSSGQGQGIYTVGSDGSNLRLLRKGSGIPIGYTDDNTLMVMDQVSNKFQVSKLGIAPGAAEKIIFADAAPGAVSLCGLPELVAVLRVCAQNIALAPFGHGLLLNAYNADGTSNLLYDNLATGTSQIIRSLSAGTGVQLPGWSTMSVTSAAA
ncbi:MAG TPA: hypothetical protein VGD98_11555 [Ktedonobacteraceae bacterium]